MLNNHPLKLHALKTSSKGAIQKTAEATGDFTGNKSSMKLQKIHFRKIKRLTHKQKKSKIPNITVSKECIIEFLYHI